MNKFFPILALALVARVGCGIGTIDANGLYTAPADEVDPMTPSKTEAWITATSTADPTAKTKVRINLNDPTPVPAE